MYYVTGEKNIIADLDTTFAKLHVTTGGGQAHPLAGSGSVSFALLSGKIKIHNNIHYVLGSAKNLLSVGIFIDTQQIAVFDNRTCLLID